MAEPTYIFKDDHVYTMIDSQVVASVKESEFDPSQLAQPGMEMPEAPAEIAPEPCPTCGQPTSAGDQFCPSCGSPLQGESGGPEFSEPPEDLYRELPNNGNGGPSGQMIAQTVTTPNGVTGRVLARVPSLWGEEVTVRFENGNIVKIPVDQRLTFAAAEETPAEKTAAQSLEERLSASFQSDKRSLIERGRELKSIKREAAANISSASDAEAVELSKVAMQADFELREVQSVLDAIVAGEVEAYEAPAPIDKLPEVVQASMGNSDASWLDQVHSEMIAEANNVDYRQLMDEGPEQFVASLLPAQIADASVTRVIATRDIEAKTAGADEKTKEAYKRMWLARVETQRKAALANYKEEVAEKTASQEESHPDESLFL